MRNPKINYISTLAEILVCAIFIFSTIGCSKSAMGPTPQETKISSVQGLLPQAEKIVLDALDDANPEIRTNAIEVIADTQQIKLMPKVVKLLEDSSVRVRFSAAMAIGDTQYLIAKNKVYNLLSDNDQNVRIAAAYALYKLSDSEKIEIIREAIKQRDQTLRANATVLLGKCGDKNSIKPLYWAMHERNSDYKVSLQAAQSIAMLKHEKIYPKLWTMLISSFADDRVMGIRGMGALGTADAKNAIITMLDDDILEVRLVAAEQLGKLNDNLGEPEVQDVFHKNLTADFDEEERQLAYIHTALAIGQIKSKKLMQYLPKLLNDPEKRVRIAAAKAVFLYAK
ncbi:MAG: HEAT repeat domain-containing protein [Planctomycetota bacterium]|jgi:HEAT repeat protein